MTITDTASLRALYGPAGGRSLAKQLDRLDGHCRQFIALSPMAMLATCGADGLPDVTPRGDAPGFVTVEDERTLLLPDRPGNNRLDSLLNIVDRPGVGLLFLVPGFDETLRVNGTASIEDDPALCAGLAAGGKPARSVLRIAVREVYFHCGKAFMRSHLWEPDARRPRDLMPSLGQILKDQLSLETGETQAEMMDRYRETLY